LMLKLLFLSHYTILFHWLIQPASPTSTLHLPPSSGIRFSSNTPPPAKVLVTLYCPLLLTTDCPHSLHPYIRQHLTPLLIGVLTHDQWRWDLQQFPKCHQ
jgi:hypothetical protein